MSFLDELAPQNTPEQDSSDFVAALTSAMDHHTLQPQPPMGPGGPQQPPPQDAGYQLPPGATAGQPGVEPLGGGGGGGFPGGDGLGPPLDDCGGFNPQNQAFMWQQDNYMGGGPPPQQQQQQGQVESGFISGATSHPSSVTGHEGDFEGDYLTADAGSSIYDLDSHSHSEISSVHSFANNSSVDEFVEGLREQDDVIADKFLVALNKFSRKPEFLDQFIQTEQDRLTLTQAVIGKLAEARGQMLQGPGGGSEEEEERRGRILNRAQHASTILRIFSQRPDGQHAIAAHGGVDELVAFLSFSLCDKVVHNSLTTIHTMLREAQNETVLYVNLTHTYVYLKAMI